MVFKYLWSHTQSVSDVKKGIYDRLILNASLFYYNAEYNVYSLHYRKYLKNNIYYANIGRILFSPDI